MTYGSARTAPTTSDTAYNASVTSGDIPASRAMMIPNGMLVPPGKMVNRRNTPTAPGGHDAGNGAPGLNIAWSRSSGASSMERDSG